MKDLVPIDQAGRIVLPKHVRQELAIKPGDLFTVSIQGATVTLKPHTQKAGFVRKGKALIFSSPGDVSVDAQTVRSLLEAEREAQALRVTESLAGPNRGK